MKITIKQSTIKALAHAMAKNDIRYYLNGMLVHTNGHDTRLVATDGQRMNVAIVERTTLVEAPQKYIIPASLVSTICKSKAGKNNKEPEVTLTFHDGKVAAELPDGTEAVAKLVDGKYPDYDRVIPKTLSREAGQYNPQYVLDAYKACADYLGVKDHGHALSMNGQNGCAARVCDGFAALIMPWSAETVTTIDSRLLSPIASPEPVAVEA